MSARPRKHKRHRPNFFINARGRPQMWQRLCWRLENFGFLFAFAILDVLAIVSFTQSLRSCSLNSSYCAVRNGMPMCFSSERAWSSLAAVVTIVMFIPFIFSIFE